MRDPLKRRQEWWGDHHGINTRISLLIPNPVVKSRFSELARAGGLRPCSPTLEGVGFYRLAREESPEKNLSSETIRKSYAMV